MLRPDKRPVRGPSHIRDGGAWTYSQISCDDGGRGRRVVGNRGAGENRETGRRPKPWGRRR